MKMGVLGSDMVAQGLSARLAELGHDVMTSTEAYLLLWVRLYGAMNTGMFNVKIMK